MIMEVKVTLKRTIRLNDNDVLCSTLLGLLRLFESGCGYLDFDEIKTVSFFEAYDLEKMGVLKRYEDALFYEGENFDKFMEFLREPDTTQVLSL
jgi:hypothetical protein